MSSLCEKDVTGPSTGTSDPVTSLGRVRVGIGVRIVMPTPSEDDSYVADELKGELPLGLLVLKAGIRSRRVRTRPCRPPSKTGGAGRDPNGARGACCAALTSPRIARGVTIHGPCRTAVRRNRRSCGSWASPM